MPYDITMCPGDDCPLRDGCYRYLAVAAGRQDWFGATPYDRAAQRCAHFWDVAELMPTVEQVRDRAYFVWVARGRPEGEAESCWCEAERELTDAARSRLRR